MFKNYLKIAFRNISQHKGYSFINIFGLAVGLAALVLILLYVQYEFSFDRYHEKADQIYRIAIKWGEFFGEDTTESVLTPMPLAPTLKAEFPEVLSAVRVQSYGETAVSYGEKNFLEKRFFFADPDILKIFSFPLLQGDPETALKDPNSIVLSGRMAKKYFGSENPLGKVLVCNGQDPLKVTGVMKDIPANSHFVMDFVIPFEFLQARTRFTKWVTFSYLTYLLLRKDADLQALAGKFTALLGKHWKEVEGTDWAAKNSVFLQPLSKIHLYSHCDHDIAANSDIKYIYLFSAIALLILVMSCINYMNLTTARSARRSREVGLRKVVGAKRKQLIRQFLGESLVLTFIALILAVIMVEISLPAFNSFIERDLSLNLPKNAMALLGIFVLVGLLAGSYPALAISSFKPVTVIKGKFSSGPTGSALRNFLVVTQFTVSIILLVCTFVVQNQLSFIKNANVGYTKDQVVVVKIRDEETVNKMTAIKSVLLQHPDILSVSFSNALPNEMNMKQSVSWPGKPENVKALMFALFVDYDFIDLYGIKIIKGRNFSRDFPPDKQGVYLLNESAVKSLGWEEPIGRDFSGESELELRGKIVGIVKDFHLLSFYNKIEPLYLYLKPGMYSQYISVKIRGNNIPGTIKFLEKNMKTFSPAYPFEYSFFDDIFASVYRAEQKLGDAFGIFAFTAILIACLGLFGLSSLSAESRTREIGIRKVLGATVTNVTLMLSKEFTRWVLLANIIAWPIAYVVMKQWLQNFAYRAVLGIEIFILSGLLALLIALGTVSYQSIRAAAANPVESLRYE
jgi:putative ABC transport system permease protein